VLARPFLPDPYQVPLVPPPPPPRARLSRLSLSSVLAALLLGPVGAIMAIPFGWYGRREVERERGRLRGHALATVGLLLGVTLTPAWGLGLSYFAWTQRYRVDPAAAAEPPEDPPSPAVAAAPSPRADPRPRGAPPPPSVPAPRSEPPPASGAPFAPGAPSHTHTLRQGRILVVDVGRDTPSLQEELARQRAEATILGETLVVMTTEGRCDPCRGVDRSLLDPLMQTALAKVRLVRVDRIVFHEDLDGLRIPSENVPGFFLPSVDLSPRDGIDGGEWDDDIAPNIAPVLGAFVRGRYFDRREPWRPVPGSGMSL
jgi:hypothetical protein